MTGQAWEYSNGSMIDAEKTSHQKQQKECHVIWDCHLVPITDLVALLVRYSVNTMTHDHLMLKDVKSMIMWFNFHHLHIVIEDGLETNCGMVGPNLHLFIHLIRHN